MLSKKILEKLIAECREPSVGKPRGPFNPGHAPGGASVFQEVSPNHKYWTCPYITEDTTCSFAEKIINSEKYLCRARYNLIAKRKN
ncbi:MAG: hypothetical protein Q8O88_01125 [bacterium]|nr:hypothetical protein [bacterium]